MRYNRNLVLVMLWLVILSFTVLVQVNAQNQDSNRTPAPPLIHYPQPSLTTVSPPRHPAEFQTTTRPAFEDVDYWDGFVPYKQDRHDAFDWRLTKSVLLADPGNVVFSPFSVKILLVLLSEAAGSDTVTQKELKSILPRLQDTLAVRDLYSSILGSLKQPSNDYVFNIGTKIFVDNYIEPRQKFSAIAETYYGTAIQNLDFQDFIRSTEYINRWCSNITAGHINNLVTEDDVKNSAMIMLNALYFDGKWRKPFAANANFELPFFVEPLAAVRATYMTQINTFFYLNSQSLKAKVLRLPYVGSKFSMTLILPNTQGNLDEVIRNIEGDGFKRIQWSMNSTVVKVTIPKFKVEYTAHLKNTLHSLGIMEIFSEGASLPLLARGSGLRTKLKVSNVIQKSGIIVHEEGSTAFAATEVLLQNKFGDDTDEFNANRPFVYLISDESTGTLLFVGKVTDPTVLV